MRAGQTESQTNIYICLDSLMGGAMQWVFCGSYHKPNH